MKKDTYYKSSFVRLFTALALCFCTLGAMAQISVGGTPYSFKENLRNGYIPIEVMERIDLDKIRKEDEKDIEMEQPWRFGIDLDVNFNLENAGIWKALPNGDRIWQLEIVAQNAKSINLIYDDFFLPEGSSLYIYSKDRESMIGGFTKLNNKRDRSFATGITNGESAILEYYEPRSVKGQGAISIAKVIHGYKSLALKFRDFMDSGPCHVNTNCEEGDDWQDEKRSVALIMLSNNTRICTGALVNNVEENGRPFFLTANHCNGGGSSNTWIFMFNYESPGCAIVDGPTNQTVSGSIFRANNAATDMLLVELDEDPNLNFQPYFAGWTRLAPGPGGVMIHHPAVDVKKIATYDVTPRIGLASDPRDPPLPGNYWFTSSFAATTNGQSIPEGGSSGAPIFNNDGRIIGQHRRSDPGDCGNAANEFSWSGRFGISWNNGTTAASRLRDWLDPNNTNTNTMNGAYFCVNNINADYDIISSREYTVSNQITASGEVNGASTVNFQAGNQILLTEGFHVDAQGAGNFRAFIGACTPPIAPPMETGDAVIATENNTAEEDSAEAVSSASTGLLIYPNPATNLLTVEYQGRFTYTLHNVLGDEVYRQSGNEAHIANVDIANLPPGIYLLKVNTEKGILSKKFVKK